MSGKSFTLIEVVVVSVLIGLLLGFAVPQYQTVIERARITRAKNTLALVAEAQELYFLDHGEYARNGGCPNGNALNCLLDYIDIPIASETENSGGEDVDTFYDNFWDYRINVWNNNQAYRVNAVRKDNSKEAYIGKTVGRSHCLPACGSHPLLSESEIVACTDCP
ncbi:MAG: type IV pilin protein [Candidatus Omnitrophica bacterium]|nr:type IV pilin protein [Candidatus Omnitrophota bacterium]